MYRFFPDPVLSGSGPPPFDDPEPRYHPIERQDARNAFIRAHYAALIANHAVRRLNAGDSAGAIARFRAAATLNPERPELAARLRALESARRDGARPERSLTPPGYL